MKYIEKLNLFDDKFETVSVFQSAFTDKLEEMDIDPKDAIIKICSECPKQEEMESVVKAVKANYAVNGFIHGDKMFNIFAAGSSDIRKATDLWVRHDILSLVGHWCMCGLNTRDMKLAVNKYMAYIGLLMSASKPFVKVFGETLNIRRVAIIKDVDVFVNSIVDFVSQEGKVSRKVARKIVINAFDGLGWIRKSLTKGESVTIRGPWLKAFVQAIDWHKLVAFCVARGIKLTFIDFWGNEIALKDVDMILTESCFKTIKLYESWDQYCTAFEKLGHEIRVCVREHAPRLKGLPYQQGQTLMGSEDDALSFAMHAKKTVYKFHEQKNAVKLLRGAHQQAARMYPALLTESHTKRAIQEMYTTKRNDMLGGRIPELGYNAFLAPDPVAFAEHLFGLEIKGFLKAGECYCSNCKEGLVDVTRSPHLDNAHVLLNNVKECPLAEGPTMYINIWDTTTIQLRADYDGDHVWYSQDKHLLELVEQTYEKLQNIPVDWDVGKAEKVKITKSAIANFCINLIHGSEIGLYADALTKMWNNGYDRDVCDWLTYAANVLIDAAKHASVKIKKPEAVQALNNVQLPLFAMYAKADADRPVGDYWLKEREVMTRSGVKILPPRCKYTGSFLDMYSKNIQENIPEVLEVEGLEEEIFDVTKMMIDARRKIGKFAGLSKKGIYDAESGKYIDCGLFQEIAFRHSTEWNSLVGDSSFFAHRSEWEAEVATAARKEILDWAYAQYPEVKRSEEMDARIEDACYDIIVRHLFTMKKMSDGMDTVLKQAFWRIYGDKCVKVLKKNLDTTIPDFDSEEFEELFDCTED